MATHTSISQRRQNLRSILTSTRCVLATTVFDPVSARIADALGFEAGLMGGSLASYEVLGAPDLILITLSELAEQVHRCTRAGNVPLIVDGDHGYGNALNVMRTVQELDHAGAAAVMIEDTLLPRAFGPSDAAQLLPLEEGVGKLKAAIAARGNSDLVVMARTSAHGVTGIDEAVTRCKAYAALGVDALMLPGLGSAAELEQLSSQVPVPIMAGSPAKQIADPSYLAAHGVRLWSDGHQTFNVAVNALYEAMKLVRSGVPSTQLKNADMRHLLNEISASEDYKSWTREFLS